MQKLLLAWGLCVGLSACGSPATPAASGLAPTRSAPLAGPARHDTLGKPPVASPARAAARVEALTKDFATWYRYAYYRVPLSRAFKALDAAGRVVPKKVFLRQLATGKVLALLAGSEQNRPVYQLHPYAGGQRQYLAGSSPRKS